LLLAKLFAQPANLLVMDEPTNDLDAESLEILEERLVEYEGTLLVVSHDRAFLNNVVTSMIVFEPDGIREYVGGYDDWLRQTKSHQENQRTASPATKGSVTSASNPKTPVEKPASQKLSYKEKQELESLPNKIQQIESQQAELHARMSAEDYYKQPASELSADAQRMESLDSQLLQAYERLESLEARQS
jgi:ATP-binding cassette subfamily F protein uup